MSKSEVGQDCIAGFDPGTQVTGFACITKDSTKVKILESGIINLKKEEDNQLKYEKLFKESVQILKRNSVRILSVEEPFYGKNIQSMLKLGRTQGIIIAAAISLDIVVYQYSPRKVKQAVCGNGNASKQQVAGMLKILIPGFEIPETEDESDAVAIALCHSLQGGNTNAGSSKSAKSWKNFIENNPDRIR